MSLNLLGEELKLRLHGVDLKAKYAERDPFVVAVYDAHRRVQGHLKYEGHEEKAYQQHVVKFYSLYYADERRLAKELEDDTIFRFILLATHLWYQQPGVNPGPFAATALLLSALYPEDRKRYDEDRGGTGYHGLLRDFSATVALEKTDPRVRIIMRRVRLMMAPKEATVRP